MTSHLHQASKLDIQVFDEQGSFPFKEKNLSSKRIYEIHDETLRTPLEKAEVFEQLLNIPNECELWIVPVTTETSALTKSIKEEKTSALFDMLASIRDKMQFDRTFIVAENNLCDNVCSQLKELGYTFTEKTEEELQQVQVEF
ncbi:hypothetical protein F9802_16515 [Bacillus aerolatus]|uniref:Uncharacterized protein n=1 Tax=Bacillus aerolatus TaxID=2653354 RepID=A0A6I1FGX6_9BACI|nr:hypothetical protein [Bacillus aerolatus]KAB7704772.1 hypothetical protein F9802_16515 [Bacillus aerolatus]